MSSCLVVVGLAACTPRPSVDDSASSNPQGAAISTTKPAAAETLHALSLPAREPPARHLVVMLHGLGDSAEGFESLAEVLARSLPHAEFLTVDGAQPFDRGPGRQWFSIDGITESNRPTRVSDAGIALSGYLDRQLALRKLPPERLVLVGFSQGAMLSGWLAVHRLPAPAAVVMLSGRISDDAKPRPGTVSTPVLMAHGDADPKVSIDLLEPGATTLRAWGAQVTTRRYPGMGHQVSAPELADVSAFLRPLLEATP